MSRRPHAVPGRLRRSGATLLIALSALLPLTATGPAPASAAARVEVIPMPSTAGNVNIAGPVRLNRTRQLQTTVLLPDGYDADPSRRWPVLYMLHGIGDNTGTWIDPEFGDLIDRAKGFPGIIVMPEGGRSYWLDWWVGGQRKGSNWGSYVLDEVIPSVEARYRILPGRDHHAIGGLSMGGYGAMLFAAQLPTYFGSAVSLSGLLDLQTWGSENLVPFFSRMSFTRTWGRKGGPYQKATSPKALLGNLSRTRLYLTAGNGISDPSSASAWNPAAIVAGGLSELGSWSEAVAFHRSAKARGIPTELRFRQGVHGWLYWRRDVPYMLRWNPIAPAPSVTPGEGAPLVYRTMAGHGNAFGLGFRFDALPRTLIEFTRTGQTVAATGSGRVTITPGAADADASGNGSRVDCQFTAELPFERILPAGC